MIGNASEVGRHVKEILADPSGSDRQALTLVSQEISGGVYTRTYKLGTHEISLSKEVDKKDFPSVNLVRNETGASVIQIGQIDKLKGLAIKGDINVDARGVSFIEEVNNEGELRAHEIQDATNSPGSKLIVDRINPEGKVIVEGAETAPAILIVIDEIAAGANVTLLGPTISYIKEGKVELVDDALLNGIKAKHGTYFVEDFVVFGGNGQSVQSASVITAEDPADSRSGSQAADVLEKILADEAAYVLVEKAELVERFEGVSRLQVFDVTGKFVAALAAKFLPDAANEQAAVDKAQAVLEVLLTAFHPDAQTINANLLEKKAGALYKRLLSGDGEAAVSAIPYSELSEAEKNPYRSYIVDAAEIVFGEQRGADEPAKTPAADILPAEVAAGAGVTDLAVGAQLPVRDGDTLVLPIIPKRRFGPTVKSGAKRAIAGTLALLGLGIVAADVPVQTTSHLSVRASKGFDSGGTDNQTEKTQQQSVDPLSTIMREGNLKSGGYWEDAEKVGDETPAVNALKLLAIAANPKTISNPDHVSSETNLKLPNDQLVSYIAELFAHPPTDKNSKAWKIYQTLKTWNDSADSDTEIVNKYKTEIGEVFKLLAEELRGVRRGRDMTVKVNALPEKGYAVEKVIFE